MDPCTSTFASSTRRARRAVVASSIAILSAAAIALLAAPGALAVAPVAPIAQIAADGIDQLPAGYVVTVIDDAFEPTVITVPVGSLVRWTNVGDHMHSTTSDDGYWNWTLVPGSSYGVRFLSAGSYDYHCLFHADVPMRGTVVVVPLADFTPEPSMTPLPTGSPLPGVTPQPTSEATARPTLPPLPTLPPGSGAIVFDYFADEAARTKTDLFAIEADGSGERALTRTADVSEAQPDWSPDRTEVVYTANADDEATGAWRLWVLDVATGATRPLTAGPADYEPEWRADGQWIVFTRIERTDGVPTRSAIVAIAPDGSGEHTLLALDSTSYGLLNPSWSPSGDRIAFTLSSNLFGSELYVMNADGSGARKLFDHPGWHDIDPVWSPDGRYIAFASGTAARHDIWLIDLVRGVAGAIVQQPAWDLRRPAWSPDGAWIVFNAQFQQAPPRWALYMVPATGGTVSGPLTLGVEPDWGSASVLPTPAVPPTATPTPEVPPTPPSFPTIPPPAPTAPGPTPTFPPPPTFEPPTPGPIEPTPTAQPIVPTATTMAEVMARIYLPSALRDAALTP